MFEKKVFKCEDKLFVKFKNKKGQEEQRELKIAEKDFEGEPEHVSVGVGITISPKQYESIRIDYHCKINHQAGDAYREDAFNKAYYYCTSKIEEHVMDLYQSKVLKEADLIPQQEATPVIVQEEEPEEIKVEEEKEVEEIKEQVPVQPKQKKKAKEKNPPISEEKEIVQPVAVEAEVPVKKKITLKKK